MTQPVRLESLLAPAAASFEQPFEMLRACHERMQRMLALLARLRVHLRTHGADTQAQQAARDVMRYFDLAAPLHHQDEELHVFPRLLAQGDAPMAQLVRQLQQDHAAMEVNWQAARRVLAQVAEGGPAPGARDEQVLDAFASLYDSHIAAEEQVAYPAAQAGMDAADIATAGQEMARRRGST